MTQFSFRSCFTAFGLTHVHVEQMIESEAETSLLVAAHFLVISSWAKNILWAGCWNEATITTRLPPQPCRHEVPNTDRRSMYYTVPQLAWRRERSWYLHSTELAIKQGLNRAIICHYTLIKVLFRRREKIMWFCYPGGPVISQNDASPVVLSSENTVLVIYCASKHHWNTCNFDAQ